MTCKLMAGDDVFYELEYYSVGGGFIEWKGYQPPKKGQPKYPYSTMKELLAHAEQNKLSIAQATMANEVAVSGKSEAEINTFIDKIHTATVNIVQAGLKAPARTLLPHQAQDQSGRSLRARDGRPVRGASRDGPRLGVRAGGI
jgi:L-serine dehydratase